MPNIRTHVRNLYGTFLITEIITTIFRNLDLGSCYTVYQDNSKDIPVCIFSQQEERRLFLLSELHKFCTNQIAMQNIKYF